MPLTAYPANDGDYNEAPGVAAILRAIANIRVRHGASIVCVDDKVLRDECRKARVSKTTYRAALATLERSGRVYIDGDRIRLLEY